MKVSTREIEQRQMVLEIEVEDERVERAMDEAYKRVANKIRVPGFRPGRAPRPLVERMVGREAILENAVEHLVPQVYRDALEDQQIKAVGQPSVEVTSTEPLQFKATVPLEPTVRLGDYQAIDVPLDPIVVEEAEVEEVVENLRQAHATWAPVERAVRVGDRIGMNVKATRGERTVMDTSDAEFVVNPTGPEPYPGFSEQLVGLEAGQDREFTLGATEASTTDEGEEIPATEGTHFQVILHWMKEKELPEVDDEFAKAIAEQDTAEALREEIRKSIRARKEAVAKEKQREGVVKRAVEAAQVAAPPQMIEARARQILETMASGLDRQGISVEQYLQFTGKDEDTFRSELMTEGEEALKRSLVLEAIARAEGLSADEAEVREEIELAARGAKNPARTAREAFARPETRARIESILLTRKGARRLLELAGVGVAEGDVEAEAPTEPSEITGD